MSLKDELAALGRPLNLVVTGGRDYADLGRLVWALSGLNRTYGIRRLAHGGARGADTLAGDFARDFLIDVAEYPVDERLDGPWPAAGPRRNLRMLEEEHLRPDGQRVDLLVAFPGGAGTANCCKLAAEMGMRIWRVR